MEYVPGQNLKDVDLETRKESSTLGLPGPIGGGEPRGYLWGDDGAKPIVNSVEKLSTYMNTRLDLCNDSFDFTPRPLVLCHLDLC